MDLKNRRDKRVHHILSLALDNFIRGGFIL